MIGEVKQLAKKKLAGNWEVAILTVYLVLLGTTIVSAVTLGLGSLAVTGPVSMGAMLVFNAIIREEKADWRKVFAPFKDRFADSFIVGLVYTLLGAAPLVGGVIVITSFGAAMLTTSLTRMFNPYGYGYGYGYGGGGHTAVMLLEMIIIVAILVALVILFYMYSEGYYILIREKDIKGFAALKKSRLMMSGKKASLFLFDLSFIGWWILEAITLGLASIYVEPYYRTARLLMLERIYEECGAMDIEQLEALRQTRVEPRAYGENVRFCKYCGAPIPSDAIFCGKCGRSQIEE